MCLMNPREMTGFLSFCQNSIFGSVNKQMKSKQRDSKLVLNLLEPKCVVYLLDEESTG